MKRTTENIADKHHKRPRPILCRPPNPGSQEICQQLRPWSPAASQPRKRKLSSQNNPSSDSQNSQNSQNSQISQNSTAGFYQLQALLPGLAEGSSVKVSKAAQLMRAAEHIRGLKTENQNLEEEILMLQASNNDLLNNILSFQTQLGHNGKSRNTMLHLLLYMCPCAGCPGSTSSGTLEDMFSLHVRASSLQNWKYSVFAQILQPLLSSYVRCVNTINCGMYQTIV